MASGSSDDEIRETKLTEPSPVKERSTLIQSSEKRNEVEKEQQDLGTKLNQIDEELYTYLIKKMTIGSPGVINPPSYLKGLQIERTMQESDHINFEPTGRPFFVVSEDCMKPSSWFPKGSTFHKKTLAEFIAYVKTGSLHPKSKSNTKEAKLLRLYCLQLLTIEKDPYLTSIILKFLSFHPITYDMILLAKKGSSNFGRFLYVLQASVKSFEPDVARLLFRDTVMASLDELCIFCEYPFPSFLTTCLQVSTTKFPVNAEIDWIINQNLDPEELAHLLEVLPQSGPFRGMGLQLTKRSIEQILECPSSDDDEVFTLQTLVPYLKEQEAKILSLSNNSFFHFMNFLGFIFLRLTSFETKLLEQMHSVFEVFKTHYDKQPQNISIFIINEAINRFLGTVEVRVPTMKTLHRS